MSKYVKFHPLVETDGEVTFITFQHHDGTDTQMVLTENAVNALQHALETREERTSAEIVPFRG